MTSVHRSHFGFLRKWFVICGVVFFTACGGGGGGSEPPPPVVTPPPNPTPPPPTFDYDGIGVAISVPRAPEGALELVKDAEVRVPISLTKVDEQIPVDIGIESAVTWADVMSSPNGFELVVDTSQLIDGTANTISLIVTNTERGLDEELGLSVIVHEPTVIASGDFPVSGGTVAAPSNEVAVTIEPGQLTSPVGVEISRAETVAGTSMYRLRFDRDVSAETARMRVDFPDFRSVQSESHDAISSSTSTQLPNGNFLIRSFQSLYVGDRRLAQNEFALPSWLQSCASLNGTTSQTDVCFDRISDASVLESLANPACFILSGSEQPPEDCSGFVDVDGVQPILFIHGYRAGGGLGGSAATWGDFRELASELQPPANSPYRYRHAAFEFRWRTNASFRVVADDLGNAIQSLHDLTGRPVHVVAHSFGGVLAKTLIRHETYDTRVLNLSGFDTSAIASVITLGSPHSGISPDEELIGPISGQAYPDGQAWVLVGACGQISCWQMGAGGQVEFRPGESELYDALSVGEVLDRISMPPVSQHSPATQPTYVDVPLIVGIGLERESSIGDRTYGDGDKFISFAGQRAFADVSEEGAFLDCHDQTYGPVTELVMGPLGADGRSEGNPRPGSSVPFSAVVAGERAFGYAHNSDGILTVIGGLDPDGDIEYAEAKVTRCPQGETCEPHAALEILQRVVVAADPVGEDAYCVDKIYDDVPTAPVIRTLASAEPDTISLSWTEAFSAFGPVTYLVFEALENQEETLVRTTQATSIVRENLMEEQIYCYYVTARDTRGTESPRSNTVCVTPNERPDAVEGWLAFEFGDPGVPGDGITVNGESNFPEGTSTYRPTTKIRQPAAGESITLSVYGARFGFSILYMLDGYPSFCFDRVGGSQEGPVVYNGITPEFMVIDSAEFAARIEDARTRFESCMSASPEDGYIAEIRTSSGPGTFDAAYLGFGNGVFPDDGLPPIPEVEGWISFEEGRAGVPDDGVFALGQSPCQGCPPQHTIVEQFPLGSADGMTISIYGTEGEAIDDITIKYSGYPNVCQFSIPIGGILPDAPTIRGIRGKALSLARNQLTTSTQIVEIQNPIECAGVSIDDAYYAAFELSGSTDLVDGTFIGLGQNSFPEG